MPNKKTSLIFVDNLQKSIKYSGFT